MWSVHCVWNVSLALHYREWDLKLPTVTERNLGWVDSTKSRAARCFFFRFCCKTIMETSSILNYIRCLSRILSFLQLLPVFICIHLTLHPLPFKWLEFHGIANLTHARLPKFWKIDGPLVVLKHQIRNILQPRCGTEYIVKNCWNFQWLQEIAI